MTAVPPCFSINFVISSVFREPPMAIRFPFNPFPIAVFFFPSDAGRPMAGRHLFLLLLRNQTGKSSYAPVESPVQLLYH